MSTQPYLMAGNEPISHQPSPAPVHSRSEAIPGEGRHLVRCEMCNALRRRKRPARFCSSQCKDKHRHAQGEAEKAKKVRAMKGSAAKNAEFLELARKAARQVALAGDGTADADRVRFWLEEHDMVVVWGGWSGSIFQTKNWQGTGRRVACKHEGSRARKVEVWRLVG